MSDDEKTTRDILAMVGIMANTLLDRIELLQNDLKDANAKIAHLDHALGKALMRRPLTKR